MSSNCICDTQALCPVVAPDKLVQSISSDWIGDEFHIEHGFSTMLITCICRFLCVSSKVHVPHNFSPTIFLKKGWFRQCLVTEPTQVNQCHTDMSLSICKSNTFVRIISDIAESSGGFPNCWFFSSVIFRSLSFCRLAQSEFLDYIPCSFIAHIVCLP